MSWIKEKAGATLDLMEPEARLPVRTITLQDFTDLTSSLPKDTELFALIFDDDDVEYSKRIISAAVRIERGSDGSSTKQIELKVEVEAWA